MPVQSSSRRNARRRQNSEEIEDDRPTQRQATDDVSDEEAAPRRRPQAEKGATKQKKAATQTQDSDDEEDLSESEDEDERIDVSQLRDQPLPSTAVNGFRGLVDDWGNIENTTRSQWTMMNDIATAIADATDEDNAKEPIGKLDEIMRQFIDLSAVMIEHSQSIDEVRQKIAQGQQIDNAFERYLATVQEKKQSYGKKTTRQKYARNDGYVQFRSAIWEVQNPNEPMPPLTDFIDKEDGDDSDDEDLEIGGQTQDFKCPITLTPLDNPLTSSSCGHSYSAAAIRAMFANARGRKPCPAAGCRKEITLADCKPNPELAKKAKKYARRMARQEEEEHSEVDEVIE